MKFRKLRSNPPADPSYGLHRARMIAMEAAMDVALRQRAPLSVAKWLELENRRKQYLSMFTEQARPNLEPEEDRWMT